MKMSTAKKLFYDLVEEIIPPACPLNIRSMAHKRVGNLVEAIYRDNAQVEIKMEANPLHDALAHLLPRRAILFPSFRGFEDGHGNPLRPDADLKKAPDAGSVPLDPKDCIPFFEAWKFLQMGNRIARGRWPCGHYIVQNTANPHEIVRESKEGPAPVGSFPLTDVMASDWYIVK